jgi:hypothetical protein
MNWDMTIDYMKNSLKRDDPKMIRIYAAALNNIVAVSSGYSKNHNTRVERTICGEGHGRWDLYHRT